MISVRRTLLIFLVVSLFVLSTVIVALSYLSTVHEMNELYDANMEQMAQTLAAHLDSASGFIATPSTAGKTDDDDDDDDRKADTYEEEDFLIQIWNRNHQLVYSSHPHVPFPEQEGRGFSVQTFAGDPWRIYVAGAVNGQVQFSQPDYVRTNLMHEIVEQILLPLLLLFPLIVLFVWISVGRGLRPLKRISEALRRRDAHSMAPLEPGKVPAEIAPLVKELNALLGRLRESMAVQQRFTADAAHELRTPLAALQLQLDLVKRAVRDEEKAEATARMQEGINRATRLVVQLLTLARLEPGVAKDSRVRFDFDIVVREEIEALMPVASARSISLDASHIESTSIVGKKEEIRILVCNLIDNALRFTPEGGKVDVRTSSDHERVELIVSDNGIGIPETERRKIFERFYRIKGSGVSGTGLGLALVSSVVERYGGTISIADGEGGKGTAFTVCLPRTTSPEPGGKDFAD